MRGHIFVLGCHAFLDLASVEDWGKEKFAEGVGIKWKKPLRQTSKLQAKRAAKVYWAFHSKIMPALWAKCIKKILLIRKRINHVIQVFEIILNSWLCWCYLDESFFSDESEKFWLNISGDYERKVCSIHIM